ncbi:hypothetical protein NONI108955_30865 [Nocardia ninae]
MTGTQQRQWSRSGAWQSHANSVLSTVAYRRLTVRSGP